MIEFFIRDFWLLAFRWAEIATIYPMFTGVDIGQAWRYMVNNHATRNVLRCIPKKPPPKEIQNGSGHGLRPSGKKA